VFSEDMEWLWVVESEHDDTCAKVVGGGIRAWRHVCKGCGWWNQIMTTRVQSGPLGLESLWGTCYANNDKPKSW